MRVLESCPHAEDWAQAQSKKHNTAQSFAQREFAKPQKCPKLGLLEKVEETHSSHSVTTFASLESIFDSVPLRFITMAKARARNIVIKLVSSAKTGYFYTRSRPRAADKLAFMKFDPRVNKHVLFTEQRHSKSS